MGTRDPVRLILLLAAVAAATPVAAAALTTVAGGAVGTGSALVAACDEDGFGASFVTSGGAVTSVTVSGLADPGCDGGAVRVALVDSSGAAVADGGPVTVAADGDTADGAVTIPVTGLPAADSVHRVQIVVEGP